MAYEFKLPDLGEGLTEGEIARWLVSVGQDVAEDDPLVEIQTDKTTVEIPSPAAGVVAEIRAAEGDVVPVGTVIVVIGAAKPPVRDSGRGSGLSAERTSGGGLGEPGGSPSERAAPADTNTKPQAPPTASDARVRATPLVRRLAQELGVDLASLAGSGPQGRVTEDDVRAAAAVGELRAAGESRVPLRGIRRLIAEHMARAHREVAPVTWVEECDFGAVDLRLLVATALKACAVSLQAFPELNARLDGDEIVLVERYDLGVAVQTEQGLVVPVVRDCDTRSVDELHDDVARLAEGARAGTLRPEELRGSTFTLTSAGKLAGLFQTPIVNHPEVAILSLGRIADRPVVREGEVVVRPLGHVAITFDHRVIDGARAAEFGLAVIARLESGTDVPSAPRSR